MANSDQGSPLSGVQVLDLTRLLPGPLASLHLADLGADVIKIEDPVRGDYARWMGPLRKTESGWFLAINRNKRSVALDLKSPAGKQALLDLVQHADVVIEGFRPGVMQRLGIGFDALRCINPALVLCSISGYGQQGPYRHKAGHDINYCALTGLLEQSGSRNGPPAPGNFQIADLAGGALSAVVGILSALYSVARGGTGRHVDIAMADCAAVHGIMPLMELQALGSTRPRGEGFLTGRLPNYSVYRCSDGQYMAVGALEPQFWQRLCEALGRPDLVAFDPSDDAACDAVRDAAAALFALHPREHWTQLLSGVDCCTGPVLTMAEAMEDPHIKQRHVFFTAEHPLEGDVTQFGCPFRMTGFRFELKQHAPGLGEHTAEVLQGIGYHQAQIDGLDSTKAAKN